MFAPKRILVPTDFSKYSDRSLGEALDIAKQHGSTVYLLHVVSVVQQCSVDYCIDPASMAEIEKQTNDRTSKMMTEQMEKFPESKSVMIIPDIRRGTPYEVILKEQEDKNVDLIVIASHGTTGLLKHLLGSVAEKVSRSAKCPVLLIRADADNKER
ncbi:MAG TPA: universal stress protein [Syntrophorhabdaceae bacterium]|nr:universal stress protein [Syntrophorhabdaceae bacterium]